MDASGYSQFIKAFILALDGMPVPPLLAQDPWAVLLPDALCSPSDLDAIRGWTVWGAEAGVASRQAEQRDFEADGPVQQRTIYFPATEIARLKHEALQELHSAGYPTPFLSTNDVVAAWLYKVSQINLTKESMMLI